MALRASPLPADIIQDEIFIRLPVKSLVRCRLVCKLWNSLFSNLSFIQNHLEHTTTTTTSSCISQRGEEEDEYLLVYENVYLNPRVLNILSRRNLSQSRISKLPYTRSSKNHIHFVGSINGLICLVDLQHHHFILWNPAIHWFNEISIPCLDQETMYPWDMLFGFGWDSLANDYKLVAKHRILNSTMNIVYSCKTNTYQQLVSKLPCLPWTDSLVIVRGIPYWKSTTRNQVLKFDVRINEFTYFEITPDVRRGEYSLINLNDSLALVDYYHYYVQREGSGMETRRKIGTCVYSFDEQDSTWSKIYTINTAVDIPISTMCFKNGGEILLNGMACLYDPKLNDIKTLPGYRKTRRLSQGVSYTPTMLALQGMKPFMTCSQKLDDDDLASYIFG